VDTTAEREPDPTDVALPGEAEPTAAPAAADGSETERSNLAAFMTEELQKNIATKVRERFDRDLSSRADRMKRLRDLQEMYALIPKPKNFPFHKSANVRTPALTAPNLQIQARLYDMVWPANGRIFSVVPGPSDEDQAIARITETFGNSYVRYKMPYMAQGLDDTLHQTCLYGSGFRRTYWDGYCMKVRSDWVPIDDFVVHYKQRSQDPSMSDVPRYTYRHWLTLAELEEFAEAGVFVNVEDIPVGVDGDRQRSEFAEAADKIAGQSTEDDEADDDTPRPVLEQHCRWKMPNQPKRHPAFNGKSRYVVILIDAWSGKLLRVALREEDDPDDRRRFERQMQAFETYQQELVAFAAKQQAQLLPPPPGQDLAGPPVPGGADMAMGLPPGGPPDTTMPPPGPPPGPPDTTLPPGAGALFPPPDSIPNAAAPPPQPAAPLEPPAPVAPPAPIRKRQICFFTHYRCFPSDGFYGLGYGDLLFGLAMAQNTILNQHIDGVTLKNSKPMFMSRQLRMQRGQVNVQPGEAIEVDAPMGSIREAIMFLDPPENDPTTVPLVKMLDGMKDQMAGSADLMSGQIPGSNQTKGGLQILAEQAMAPITVLARRIKEAFRHELEKIWRCFGVFLEDEEIADVVGEGGKAAEITVGKWMFTPTAHLVPASDPRMKSQRVEDHMSLVQYVSQNPIVMQNPQLGMPILSQLLEQGLRIFPDGDKLLPILQRAQQPPPPPPPPQPKPQWAENAGFLTGQDSPVLPSDNDDEHLGILQMFMQDPDAQAMDKVGRDMAEKHLRAHLAQRMMKKGAAFEQQRQQALPGSVPGGPPAMAGPANHPAFPAPPRAGA
jgi:hypothetical protein